MIAEVISIGDELTSGQRLDTNSQWLSDQLGQLGVRVLYHSTVADDLEANVSVFRTAAARADLVVATGGLGPTADDLTRDVLAELAGRELVLDEGSLEHVAIFARYKRDMPESNRVQAMFPAGSQVLPNPNGTAPGIGLVLPRPAAGACHVFALPGVPYEMFAMFQTSVAPVVLRLLGKARFIRHRRIKCFGAGESHVEQMLPDLIRRGRKPTVGITVSEATITLRITAEGDSEQECRDLIEPTEATIRQCLGTLVYGEEDDELEDAVLRLLAAKDLTLALVEAGTCGHVAARLGRAARDSRYYRGGRVIGGSESLALALGTRADLLEQHGPTSREVAEALAVAARQELAADLALAIGPFPANVTADPKLPFHFALATAGETIVKAGTVVGHPAIGFPRTAKGALNLVRLTLLG